ncbi:hypothetical protein PUN28_015277 [Cardiocondyla obscurior]|uniref:Uncharacterized protein n=1 Tax=Cardiocondyla obscurior TaxID=286306 RepID=A0AAW2EY97_9HYME
MFLGGKCRMNNFVGLEKLKSLGSKCRINKILQTEAIDFEIINKKYKNSIIIKDCKENILFEENININIVKSHDKESVNNQCMKDQHKFTTERSGCINFPTTFSALTYDLEQKLKTDVWPEATYFRPRAATTTVRPN